MNPVMIADETLHFHLVLSDYSKIALAWVRHYYVKIKLKFTCFIKVSHEDSKAQSPNMKFKLLSKREESIELYYDLSALWLNY